MTRKPLGDSTSLERLWYQHRNARAGSRSTIPMLPETAISASSVERPHQTMATAAIRKLPTNTTCPRGGRRVTAPFSPEDSACTDGCRGLAKRQLAPPTRLKDTKTSIANQIRPPALDSTDLNTTAGSTTANTSATTLKISIPIPQGSRQAQYQRKPGGVPGRRASDIRYRVPETGRRSASAATPTATSNITPKPFMVPPQSVDRAMHHPRYGSALFSE